MSAFSLSPSRRALVITGITFLLAAGALTWTWRSVIFAHTSWPPAHTQVVRVIYPGSDEWTVQSLTPGEFPPSGGLLMRLLPEVASERP